MTTESKVVCVPGPVGTLQVGDCSYEVCPTWRVRRTGEMVYVEVDIAGQHVFRSLCSVEWSPGMQLPEDCGAPQEVREALNAQIDALA